MLKSAVLLWIVIYCKLALSSNVTVELALFCDVEFDEFFEQNETRIREYWAARLFDADLRFKSLPSVDMKFVVTSLTIFKNKTSQAFIESSRDLHGKVSIDNVVQKFALWLQHNEGPEFDVALLGLGAATNDNHKSRAFVAGACRTSIFQGKLAAAVFRVEKDDLWNSCGSIEFALSTVLGAWGDERDTNQDCLIPRYIISKECSQNHYFFSKCSDRAISEHIRTTGTCLQRIAVQEPSVFNIGDLSVRPPSILEQCALAAKNSNVWINQSDENRCFSAKCYLNSQPSRIFLKTIYPVDNSPCDNNKSCFRGRCISNGFQLMNVATSKCLHSTNRFASDDQLELRSCSELPTPLDMFMLLDNGENGIFLATPYSSVNASENSDKCLGPSGFTNCYDLEKGMILGWELIRAQGFNETIIIRHKLFKFCLEARKNHLQLSICEYQDPLFHWKLLRANSDTELPHNLFKSIDILSVQETSTLIATILPVENMNTSSVNQAKISSRCHNWGIYVITIGISVLAAYLLLVIFRQRKLLKMQEAERVLINFNDIQHLE